jgi:hypothetical protein
MLFGPKTIEEELQVKIDQLWLDNQSAARYCWTVAAVWTRALSQCSHQSWDDMTGLYFLKIFRNLAADFLMYFADHA